MFMIKHTSANIHGYTLTILYVQASIIAYGCFYVDDITYVKFKM